MQDSQNIQEALEWDGHLKNNFIWDLLIENLAVICLAINIELEGNVSLLLESWNVSANTYPKKNLFKFERKVISLFFHYQHLYMQVRDIHKVQSHHPDLP